MSDVTSKERLTEKLANLEATYRELEDRKNEFIEERKLADGKITAVVTEQTSGNY